MKKKPEILIIDDEKSILESLSILLKLEGYDIFTAENVNAAVKLIREKSFSLIISDVRMPKMSGIDFIKYFKNETADSSLKYKQIPVILMTAFSDIKTGIEAIKLGAFDYLIKPFDNEEFKIIVRRAIDYFGVLDELHNIKKAAKVYAGEIKGGSKAIIHILNEINKVSAGFNTILITGESGTGKELAARLIYEIYSKGSGGKKNIPFVPVNIAAIPENLIESELFGYAKGAFTGAETDKMGLIKYADGGILFLDEIGDLPMQVQVKLLRLLQEKTCRRLGSNREEPVSIKIIAATNIGLDGSISAGKFRDDLYYRLNKINIKMPPLRNHKEDVPELISYFIKKYSKNINSVSKEALEILTAYDYPGNVRELENIIERACIYCEGGVAQTLPNAGEGRNIMEIGLECLPDYVINNDKSEKHEETVKEKMPEIQKTYAHSMNHGKNYEENKDGKEVEEGKDYMADIADIFNYVNKTENISLPDFIKKIENYITANRIKTENSKIEAAKSLGLSLRSLRYILSKEAK